MGNGMSSMGDLFYPDNPKRRARARQLRDDIQDYARQFDELKKQRDQTLKEIQPRLKQLLNKYGYNSPEELDRSVKQTLKGDALKEYLRISQKIDTSDEIVSDIFQIIGIISVASGLVLAVLVALTVITGGAALAAIGAIGAVLGIVALVAVLFSVFEGAEERSNLQKAIRDLSYERVKARAALEGMRAISNWVENIKMWLDEPLISDNEEIMKKKIEGDFTNDFNKSKRPYVVQYLEKIDQERGAWTNEDPDWHSGAYDIISVDRSSYAQNSFVTMSETVSNKPDIQTSKIDVGYSNFDEKGELHLTWVTNTKATCQAVDSEENEWIIEYESGPENALDPENPRLEKCKFLLKNFTTGKVLEGCQLELLKTTIR